MVLLREPTIPPSGLVLLLIKSPVRMAGEQGKHVKPFASIDF